MGFRATRPFGWLHVDITQVQTVEDGIQKVAFVRDNFSTAILHYKSTDGKAGSEFITELFKETFEMYDIYSKELPVNILSDGGPENKGVFLDWLDELNLPLIVRKVTALSDVFPFSNSMSERIHSIYKSEFMQGKLSQNKITHLKNLNDFQPFHNNHRYPIQFHGYTPLEILDGKIPDKTRYKNHILNARKKRVKTNQHHSACVLNLGC